MEEVHALVAVEARGVILGFRYGRETFFWLHLMSVPSKFCSGSNDSTVHVHEPLRVGQKMAVSAAKFYLLY